jgi:hypothetical protein
MTSETIDDVSYDEFKFALLEDYLNYRQRGDKTIIDCVSKLIDEVTYMMHEAPLFEVCTILTASIICLREGFLPTLLHQSLYQLPDLTPTLKGRARLCYLEDFATINALLNRTQYTLTDEFFLPEFFAP